MCVVPEGDVAKQAAGVAVLRVDAAGAVGKFIAFGRDSEEWAGEPADFVASRNMSWASTAWLNWGVIAQFSGSGPPVWSCVGQLARSASSTAGPSLEKSACKRSANASLAPAVNCVEPPSGPKVAKLLSVLGLKPFFNRRCMYLLTNVLVNVLIASAATSPVNVKYVL